MPYRGNPLGGPRADYTTSLFNWQSYWSENWDHVPRKRSGRPPTEWLDQPFNFWRFMCALDLAPAQVYEQKPKGFYRGEVPTHPVWRENLFILATGGFPLLVQIFSYLLFPEHKWHWFPAFMFYHLVFVYFLVSLVRRMHYYMVYYGTLDESHRARDIVGDNKVDKLGKTIFFALFIRVAGTFVLTWNQDEMPGLSIWTPVKLGLYEVALDYFFYCYHRTSHQVDALWWVHRTHHSTRHPTPTLTILADDVQDSLEITIIPLLAEMMMPLNFAELWLAQCYLIYVEAMGHSGIRAYWVHPIVGHILRPFGMELAVEDHDLHHRFGRSGTNFGKQTRVWDKVFGTVCGRVEHLFPEEEGVLSPDGKGDIGGLNNDEESRAKEPKENETTKDEEGMTAEGEAGQKEQSSLEKEGKEEKGQVKGEKKEKKGEKKSAKAGGDK